MSLIKYVFIGDSRTNELLNQHPELAEETVKENSTKIFEKYCSSNADNSKDNVKSKVVFDEGKYFFKINLTGTFILVFCDSSVSEQKAFGFVEELEKVPAIESKASTREIKNLMESYQTSSNSYQQGDFDSLGKAKNEINNLTAEMKKNVAGIMLNIDQSNQIESKSAHLKDSSHSFKQHSIQLQRQTWWNNMRMYVILMGLVILFVIAIYFII